MSRERHARISELFAAARRLSDEERLAYLDEACAEDPFLRREVEALLANHARPTPLDEPVTDRESMFAAIHPGATTPERIGRFRVLRQIGEGAMGVVYEAEQDHPRRTVALKLLRSQWSTAVRIRRFEREAQIVARLQHSSIAQLFDAGVAQTDRGSLPFLAMELVAGEPLTTFAATVRLGVRARLELFALICDAVDYAHRHGVIHRDLKPANILVTTHGGGAPRPKILDFGVARVTDADITMLTVETHAGQLIGTLPYMSPEQVEARPDELDARSDVYALGVVLYELLTGRLPHDLRELPIAEASRIIREDEPSRLSTHDTTLRGEVETITTKALAKDRTQRYASAADLAADVRRYLADQPIVARPPSSLYQFRKFAKRNRGVVGGVIIAIAALVIGLIMAIYQAAAARQTARANESILHELELFLLAANTRPYRSAFFTQTFAPSTSLGQVIRQFADLVDQRDFEDPAVEAALRFRVGRGLFMAGDWVRSERHLRRAQSLYAAESGEDSPRSLAALAHLGMCLSWMSNGEDPAPMIERAAAGLETSVGIGDPDWFHAMTAITTMQVDQGDRMRCARMMLDALDQTGHESDFPRYEALLLVAEAHCQAGQFAECEAMLSEVVAGCEAAPEQRYFGLAVANFVLSKSALGLGDPERAESCARATRRLFLDNQGADSDWVAWSELHLGYVLWNRQQGAEALELWQASFRHFHSRLGATSRPTMNALASIALGMSGTLTDGQRAQWRTVIEETTQRLDAETMGRDERTLSEVNRLAWNLGLADEVALAAPLARIAVARLRDRPSPTVGLMLATDTLAVLEQRLGNSEAALGAFEELHDLQAEHELMSSEGYAEARLHHGELLLELDRPREALVRLEGAMSELAERDRDNRARAATALATACEKLGRRDDAARWRERLAEIADR